MSKARDLANAGTALTTVSATELGYLDGVTSAIQTQVDAKIAKTLTTTTGDIIYASSANTPARLGIGSTDQVLKVTGGVPAWATPASGGKVLQVVFASTSTLTTVASTTPTDSGLTASITPSAASSKILVIYNQSLQCDRSATGVAGAIRLLRGATTIQNLDYPANFNGSTLTFVSYNSLYGATYLDSPSTTSSTTYKTQVNVNTTANSGTVYANNGIISSITLLEIGA